MNDINNENIIRKKIIVNGIVQGVGFRPFIRNLAAGKNVSGTILNSIEGVEVEVQGPAENIKAFEKSIVEDKPTAALILQVLSKEIALRQDEQGFHIKSSRQGEGMNTLISPDLALCSDCRRELLNPGDRRYLYPFINCTNCGPRFTIIEDIPYDRPTTVMRKFEMCPSCLREYKDPEDRRYHAQPNACPECGPRVALHRRNADRLFAGNAVEKAAAILESGGIIAVKGLGGYHLAVDADNAAAVKELRRRKKRDEKPFAVMVEDVQNAEAFVKLNRRERDALASSAAPIVLAERRFSGKPVDDIAPGNPRIGIMTAYAPLHILLFHSLKKVQKLPVLVMTSANYSEEPVVIDNDEAVNDLLTIADAILLHNRDILLRADDSVIHFPGDKMQCIRRSRGYVPIPIIIKNNCITKNNINCNKNKSYNIISVGAELKNTVGILKNDRLFLSSHIGDLTNLKAYGFFQESITHLQRILKINPGIVACDRHPAYLSTKWAEGQTGKKIIRIQHHHAHMASVMAEHGIEQDVIGLILDGTGYGYDGKIWGGEIFTGGLTRIRRVASFRPMPLPGGDAAVKAPWKIALAYLLELGLPVPDEFLDKPDSGMIMQLLEKKLNTPYSSSCGRLFDAASVLAGGPEEIRYEAQAAIEFMNRADPECGETYNLHGQADNLIDPGPLLQALLQDSAGKTDSKIISARFHNSLAEILVEQLLRVRSETGLNTVVISGGVFQNKILFNRLVNRLYYEKFELRTNELIPVNDGGIAAGQAMVAAALHAKGLTEPDFSDDVHGQ